MKLKSLLQEIDGKVPVLIRFCFPIRFYDGASYGGNEVYYSGRLSDMPYESYRKIQYFKVSGISIEEHEYDVEISITIK